MRRRGFTLAEVLLAIFFVTIAMFALVSLQIRLMMATFKLEIHQVKCETADTELVAAMIQARTASDSTAVQATASARPPGPSIVAH